VATTVETWRTNERGVRVPVREVLVPKSHPARFAGTTVRHPYLRAGSLCGECYGYPDDPRHNLPGDAQRALDARRLRDGKVIDDRRSAE
jgi:hypothetical protein